MMRLYRPFFMAPLFYPGAIFRLKMPGKVLCITFDDGPDPGSTPRLLDILGSHAVRAIFFCDGRAAEKNPRLVNEITDSGHVIGNHGYNHLDGWMTPPGKYADDVKLASKFTSGKIFRPPYGRLRGSQFLKLRRDYKIIFWDLMPHDFNQSLSPSRCLAILKKMTRPGSIIVLHDTPRSSSGIFLDEFLYFVRESGYSFALPGY
jgi:peptidoglycan/xylan/chitin deacetylase (PgdA/CDA1 family)